MNEEPPLIRRVRTVLADLRKLVDERVAAERQLQTGFQTRTESIERDYAAGKQRVDALDQQDGLRLEMEYSTARSEATARRKAETGPLEREHEAKRQEIAERYESVVRGARQEWEDSEFMAVSLWEGNQKGAVGSFEQWQRDVQALIDRLRALWEESGELLIQYRQGDLRDSVGCQAAGIPETIEPLSALQACLAAAESELMRLKMMGIPKLFTGFHLVWPLLVLCGGLFAVSVTEWGWPMAAIIAVGGTAIGGSLLWLVLQAIARKQVLAAYLPLCQAVANAEAICQQGLAIGAARHKRQLVELEERRKRELQQARQRLETKSAEAARRRDEELRQAEQWYPPRIQAAQRRYEEHLRQLEAKYPPLIEQLNERLQVERGDLESRRKRQLELSQRSRDSEWKLLASNWQHGIQYIRRVVDEINEECRRCFPPWDDRAWQSWQPPTDVPEVIPIGEFDVALADLPGGMPRDERLRDPRFERFTLPALVPFSDTPSLLFHAAQQGREQAVSSLQNLMLRLLTSLPPGKIRFTIIDPVGLGQNFAAFMRLADHDEALVTSRIWTEPGHIEQRLTDLTAQMENIIQKYLRNEFQSIEEYNRHAGEVAEPFRVLVIANFPQNFSDAAATRLLSVAASGARCGVRVLASIDRQQPLPRGFDVRDLAAHALNLEWSDSRFQCSGVTWQDWPLRLAAPPDAATFRRILEDVGEQSRDARRVEVPFEFIAPSPEQWWTADSRQGVNVPLGRAGATRRQPLKLGQGTSQHVLIAGKTGSGKSTLLHALITNLALLYNPDEVELYLIDFKKGVEFKTYAQHELPHARVVAIESEREFGLSVLERLDVELRRRGELFRDVNVQDLAGYREVNGNAPLARILLIVDEFQELFVEDDKLSQESALLLDRLVRQGRAFGIHVLLGSQTLGGAYSLARSTIGQMAVRIALQCSETDAHLILSEDNSAARLLSRPGEAIYNDSNGLVEGNHPFQVVWLSDDRREEYLRNIQQLAQERGFGRRPPQIVFEGNTPAEVAKNHLLTGLLAEPQRRDARQTPQAWLGEAVAIKDPTAAEFAPQTGNNLLMVGQRDVAATAMMTTSLISLAAQHAADESGPRPARFFLLDGTAADASYAGYLRCAAQRLPHPLEYGGHRDAASLVGQLYDEVQRRQQTSSPDDPTLYFFVFDLRRFRDLRKDDDDFGFGKSTERPSVAKQFATILREGPALGVHTIVWCDTLSTLQRSLERQSQREFEAFVLFQMSASDSSQLIDTPAASKLGAHRAYLYREDLARLEKFRPYGLPSESWLDEATRQLVARSPTAADRASMT